VSARSGLAWLLVQAALVHAASMVVRPMISYRALDLGAGNAELGLIATAWGVLPLLLAFAVGRRADAWGAGRLLIGGSVLAVGGSLAALFAPALGLLYAAAASLGMAHLLLMVGQQSAVALSATRAGRDRGFGWLTSASSVGQMLGPTVVLSLAGWLAADTASVAVFGLAAAAGISLAAAPLGLACALTRRRIVPEGPRATSRQAVSRLVKADGMWRAMVTSGTVMASIDILLAFLPAWAEERGVPVAVVGWLLGLRALVTVAVRLAVGRLIATFTRRWTFVGSLTAGVVGLGMLPFVDVVGGAVAMVLLGLGLGLSQPLTLSWVTTLAPRELRGAAVGLRLTANRLAQTVVPATIALAAGSGTTGVFVGSAAVMAAATTTVLRRGTMDAPPQDELPDPDPPGPEVEGQPPSARTSARPA
jgi:MFS family permease